MRTVGLRKRCGYLIATVWHHTKSCNILMKLKHRERDRVRERERERRLKSKYVKDVDCRMLCGHVCKVECPRFSPD